MPFQNRTGEVVLRGIAASPGVCRGRAVVWKEEPGAIVRREIGEGEVSAELERLEQALITARHEVNQLQKKLADAIGAKDASIFEVHLLILEDPVLLNESARRVREERVNAAFAFSEVARHYVAMLGSVDDPFFRERATDIRDVTQRVQNHLAGEGPRGRQTPAQAAGFWLRAFPAAGLPPVQMSWPWCQPVSNALSPAF